LSISYTLEPHSFTKASKDPRWVVAMDEELVSLQANHTWTITNLPANKMGIGASGYIRLNIVSMGL